MEVLHARCAGLDVHKDTVVACARLAAGDEVQQEVRSFATTTQGLLSLADWLMALGVTHAAMEATGVYWKPVWHVLESACELVLANSAHVRNVPGRKTDVNDATWIADLLTHGLIRPSFVPPTPILELRDLTRTRKQLVREIAQHTLRIQKVLEDANIVLVHVDAGDGAEQVDAVRSVNADETIDDKAKPGVMLKDRVRHHLASNWRLEND